MSMSRKTTTGVISLLSVAALSAGTATASASPAHAQAPTTTRVAAGCSDWNRAVAVPWKWQTLNDGCGHFGRPGLRMGYSWAVFRGTKVCVKAKGFVNGSKKWFDLGCGKSGSFTVPWGNVLAEKEIQVKGTAAFNWK
ncbi:hypothetical protein [Streptomyces sp. NPDC093261]|uniref:hypothetical protein n=1 Tax=Streptomyces sp. NPDC093261 TaxID=3366037 RepID=UPI00380EF125